MSDATRTTAITSVAHFPAGAKGVTPPTNPEGTGGFLSDVIVELGFVDRETVEQAVDAAREPGRRVERILLERGALTEEELSRAIAERYGFDHVDLDQFEIDMGAARLIGRSTALRYHAVPIAFATDGALIVAVADPVDALAISDIEVMTKSEARKAVASGSTIDALAERLSEIVPRQPAANQDDDVGTASPPVPASPMVGSSTEPAPSPPASEAPGGPSTADDGAAASALEAERSRLRKQVVEAAQERDRWREAVGQVTQDRDRLSAEVQQLSAELASLRETAQERDRLSAEVQQLSAELASLRETAQERDRLSAEVQQLSAELASLRETAQERDRLSAEVQQLSAESASLRETAGRAEGRAKDASGRIRELENADRRAEAARLALTELREESEREREQGARLERKLRDELTVATERNAALTGRLSGLMAAAARAKTMAQELMALHGMLNGDGLVSKSNGAPPATSAEPQVPAPSAPRPKPVSIKPEL